MTSTSSALPYRVTNLAVDMFARETGFSGPEIHGIFVDYTDALGPYQGWGGGSLSRWQLFENGLKSMSAPHQAQFLLELCSDDGSFKHGSAGSRNDRCS